MLCITPQSYMQRALFHDGYTRCHHLLNKNQKTNPTTMKTLLFIKYIIIIYLLCAFASLFAKNGISACVPELTQPEIGATLDNGCDIVAVESTWHFDWKDCEGTTKYHLYIKGSDASYSVVNNDTITTQNLLE